MSTCRRLFLFLYTEDPVLSMGKLIRGRTGAVLRTGLAHKSLEKPEQTQSLSRCLNQPYNEHEP